MSETTIKNIKKDINNLFMHKYNMWSMVKSHKNGKLIKIQNAKKFKETFRVILSKSSENIHPNRLAYRIYYIVKTKPTLGLLIISAICRNRPENNMVKTIFQIGKNLNNVTPFNCLDIWVNQLNNIGNYWFSSIFKSSE